MKTISRDVSYDAIIKARENISGTVRRTELLPVSASLFGEKSGIFIKTESFQRTGSFKIRGAYNKLLSLSPEERSRGVVAASAGNHAQGVALAASLLGIKATIVMAMGASPVKVEATRAYGAEVVLHGKNFDEAYSRALELTSERGACFIHPFDDTKIIEGQGTIALEIFEDMPDCGMIVAPIGGGGLISGIATAAKAINPSCLVVGVEPASAPCMQRAVALGEPKTLDSATTIADGTAIKRAGELTSAICRKLVDDIVLVSEEEIAETMLTLMERMKLVAEGAGALSLAALLSGRLSAKGKTALILSGGNVETGLLGRILEKGLFSAGRRCRFEVELEDSPSALASLLELISREGAGIVSLSHRRVAERQDIGRVKVFLTLETRGVTHADRLEKEMSRLF